MRDRLNASEIDDRVASSNQSKKAKLDKSSKKKKGNFIPNFNYKDFIKYCKCRSDPQDNTHSSLFF